MPQLARRLFVLPPDLEGAAQSWLEHGERTPRKPRFASSVVLLRDSPTGLETWLGYRPGSSPLGVLAFPGGIVFDTAIRAGNYTVPELSGLVDRLIAASKQREQRVR